jgi:hypothetical protein
VRNCYWPLSLPPSALSVRALIFGDGWPTEVARRLTAQSPLLCTHNPSIRAWRPYPAHLCGNDGRHVLSSLACATICILPVLKSRAHCLSPSRHTKKTRQGIVMRPLGPDAYRIASGGPTHPSLPRPGHKKPPIFDREALRASAHSLPLCIPLPYPQTLDRAPRFPGAFVAQRSTCRPLLAIIYFVSILPHAARAAAWAPSLGGAAWVHSSAHRAVIHKEASALDRDSEAVTPGRREANIGHS